MTEQITGFFEAVLLAHLALLALLAGYYAHRPRGRKLAHHEALYRCRPCGRVYADRRSAPLAECPACGAMNEPVAR